MKKLFTLMWAVVCAALTIVSCTPDQGGDNNVKTAKITVTGAPEANLAPEAGEFSLNYAIEGATLTGALSVTTEATWVTVGEIGAETVAFSYLANSDAPGSPAREAVIKFAYDDAADVLVTVKQDSAAPSFSVEFSNVTAQFANYVCTPVDNEVSYVLLSSQELGNFGIQGETPAELVTNYVSTLASYGMLTEDFLGNYWYKGATNPEMPKEASRWSAEESVTVYAVGFSATVTDETDEWGAQVVNVSLLTAVHTWEVPFLPYPTVTVPEDQLTNNVSSAAGELVLDCVVENPIEGETVALSTEASWVTASWADNKLTIAYEANTLAVARRAKIAVQYGYYTNPFEVTIVQEKDGTAVAVTLDVKVTATQFNGIWVDVTPSDDTVTYALNQTAPEKDWETGAELEMDWMTLSENLLQYTGNATFHKGALKNHFIKMNPSNYEWNGYDYYVYAVAVNATSEESTDWYGNPVTNWSVSEILSEVYYDRTTIDASKMPTLAWDVEKSGLTWNATNERYDIEVVEGSTLVLYYTITNPVDGATVALNGTLLSDSYNVVAGEPTVDNAAGTITFQIDAYDSAKKYHYVSPTFKYTNAEGDTWGITTPSLRITQVENPGMALPYQESFENGIGNFTINDVLLGSGLSYVWKHENDQYGYYMKASGYAGSAKESESWLVSPKIDLSAATMPGLQFSHTHKFAGTPAEELTLWVKEYGAAEWTQVTIPTYGTNTNYTFVNAAVDLSAWAGKKVQIGFKYTSSTSAAGTWEIKDVVVYDAGGAAM